MKPRNKPRLRLVLVNDKPTELCGLKHILGNEYSLETVWAGPDIKGALAILKYRKIDLIMLDLPFQTNHKLAILKSMEQFRKISASVRIAILSSQHDFYYAQRFITAGAHAFIDKSCPIEEFMKGISYTLKNEIFISPRVLSDYVDITSYSLRKSTSFLHERLTNREFQILYYLTRCSSQAETARSLGISIKTVHTHKTKICTKLQVRNMAELIKYAMEYNLMTDVLHKAA